eukprot:CAMPEP_0183758276 /NCGR_PEP_ID=MMETSP0739-20130205/6318_1 /TAXON_ID=385413 /ORGANISM="Thalassiosira miniscula, Strain CCMP1093" /LENGTH=134 /DNA_ID=CAMNT_0025995857 /DNA_START=57 /DNA_END=458 /DNA_ORIENTATION=+
MPNRTPLSSPARIFQDDFSPARGNALQAAVASIFGLSLHDVPNFIESPDGYQAAINKFYQQGVDEGKCAKIKLDGSNKIPETFNNMVCILRGKSPRGDFGHVVVAKHLKDGEFEMVHDPHPDEKFLDTTEAYGW